MKMKSKCILLIPFTLLMVIFYISFFVQQTKIKELTESTNDINMNLSLIATRLDEYVNNEDLSAPDYMSKYIAQSYLHTNNIDLLIDAGMLDGTFIDVNGELIFSKKLLQNKIEQLIQD